MRTSVPGVSTGLAWLQPAATSCSSNAARVPGNGRLILTGQLGDVMKDSAQAALSLVKARSSVARHRGQRVRESDIHLHGLPALSPRMAQRWRGHVHRHRVAPHRAHGENDTAMTGEISLRGGVPVGGVKNKVLAAMRAGITTVLLPERNKKDFDDVPERRATR